MRALIIGAGLGGLCLAHGLHRAGFDVAVFERGRREGTQPASYGIHLNADGLRALRACLPAANWARLTATTAPASDVVNFHDSRGGLLSSLDFRTAEQASDPVTCRRAVTRGRLREALLGGLDGIDPETGSAVGESLVHWGKTFRGYTHTPGGRVSVSFEDGTSATGDLLVGADGSNSRVRAQRLPALQRIDLGILNVAGRVPLTSRLNAVLPSQLGDSSVNNVVPGGPGWLFVSAWITGDPGSHPVAGAERTDRYLVWAWAARRDTYPGGGDGLGGGDLKAHVQRQVADWSAPIRELIAATDPADIGPVPLLTMPQLPHWAPDDVTLLGDAIHNMTPMGGIGANTALRDADTLRTALLARTELARPARPDPGSNTDPDAADPLVRSGVQEAVGDYESRMRMYANAALALSTRNAERATDPARLPRRLFRFLLRVSHRSPGVKQRLFHTPARPAVPGTRPRIAP